MPGGPPWRWRRWLGRGRVPKPRFIHAPLRSFSYVPAPSVPPGMDFEEILPDELEALRLVYLEKKSQSEAAEIMGVSRGTVWRLLESGRVKLVRALVTGKAIVIIAPQPEGSGRP